MEKKFDYVKEQIQLSKKIQKNIADLHDHYIQQIRLTTKLVIEHHLHDLHQNAEPSCKDIDQKITDQLLDLLDESNSMAKLYDAIEQGLKLIDPNQHKEKCITRWEEFQKFAQENMNFIQELLGQSELMGRSDGVDKSEISKINPEKAYSTLIDPLSNKKRLNILLAIQRGNMRFKDLEDELDLQAGHLLYHLNPLKEAKYVSQDEQKLYRITAKGEMILNSLTRIYIHYDQDIA